MDPHHHDHDQDGLHPPVEVVSANSSSGNSFYNNNSDGGSGGDRHTNKKKDSDTMKSSDDNNVDDYKGDEMKAEQQVLLGKLELGPDGTLTADQLQMLNEARDKRLLEELGGIEAVAHAVETDLKNGLSLEDQHSVDKRVEK